MSQEDITTTLETWKILKGIRMGNKNMSNDLLFQPKHTALVNRPEEMVLCCGAFLFKWWKHEVDFEFTRRIQYTNRFGEYYSMELEIEWKVEQRRWQDWFRVSHKTNTMWIDCDRFEYKKVYEEEFETTVVDCA